MDTSSELIHSLLPAFMVTTLGASMVTVGIIEGVAEAAAAVMKVFSGALSDYLGRRKFLMVLGYTLAAFTKPIFPMAASAGWVFSARFIDRIGKGIRGAPRDALVADLTPPKLRGAAYGLRQALDSVGALLGPLLAVGLMIWFVNNIRAVMWVAVVPAFIAVALLLIYVREPERGKPDGPAKAPLALSDAKRLPMRYWLVVLMGAVFMLARFSEAFLVLRALDVGLQIGRVPFVMIVMNVFYAGAAYPAGAAADRISSRTLLFLGLVLLIAADLVLALAASPLIVFAGAALWGLHMASTQGLLSKLVADTAPPKLIGTGFGIFNLVSGGALLLASVIAGLLWSSHGASATFLAGAVFAAVAAVGLLAAMREPATAFIKRRS
ncbi:MAG: MFS transporter [Candidatus Eisenbacteria bacterium]|uniref:MFS transporter n=1 Tax=Eiseniibacteriota bacterium TaxID=2212470 RepID=A0A948RWV9_UNCEI|nr:MFS transporter [Candidatus Eisenbacteria bacterium]MBU1947927.1 MFS transporter [Candidatus Eisenbacteria bacterium]MBU2692340.1 MFS transporter [Candidatus Eisenbacteria bacterium]